MTKIICVGKNKNLKVTNFRSFSLTDLHKKANLKSSQNFIKHHTWKYNDKFISLYAKDTGRSNNENTYELPPPIDSNLFYGTMILVKHFNKDINDSNVEDLDIEEWNKVYEKMFGGFEDLGEEDSYSEEEEIPDEYKTKEGYSKEDGFVVDDDEEEDEDYSPNDDYESEEAEDYETEEINSPINSDENNGTEEENNVSDEDSYGDDEDYESDDSIGSELSEESYYSD